MKASSEYIIMGEDGKEYGPVNARQIRQWVTEGRVEKKTPVKPDHARDWIFLGDLQEFQELFPQPRSKAPWVAPRRGLVKAFVILAVVTAIYYLVQHFHLLEQLHRH